MLRNKKKTVGDAGSNFIFPMLLSPEIVSFTSFCCNFCGKDGAIIEKFPRRRYGSRIFKDSKERFYT
jgi:hypothetical protein